MLSALKLQKIKLLWIQLRSVVTIVEVGPRDGLQYEKVILPTATKVELINKLSESGLKYIECGSFVNPKLVPQMADSADVIKSIARKPGISYSVLTPNVKAVKLAIDNKIDTIAIFGAASEKFTKKNINCTIEESFQRFDKVMKLALANNIKVRGYLSCIVECPYQGPTEPSLVRQLTDRMLNMGCYQVSLGDTIGVAKPETLSAVLDQVADILPHVALHCHNTNGLALANIKMAVSRGVSVIDSSIAGLGGCPFAGPGASGNVATESVLAYLVSQEPSLLDPEMNVDSIMQISSWIRNIIDGHSRNLAT